MQSAKVAEKVRDVSSAARKSIMPESALTGKVRVKEEVSPSESPSAKVSGRVKATGKEKARVKRHRISLALLAEAITGNQIALRNLSQRVKARVFTLCRRRCRPIGAGVIPLRLGSCLPLLRGAARLQE